MAKKGREPKLVQRNFVAMHAMKFCKSKVIDNKKRYNRKALKSKGFDAFFMRVISAIQKKAPTMPGLSVDYRLA